MDPSALYYQLGHLLETMPNLMTNEWATPKVQKWLGLASALVEASGDLAGTATIRVAVGALDGGLLHATNVQTITAVLHRTLARAELAAPAAAQGSFLPVGEPLAAFAAVGKVLGGAKSSALIVDPYADANLLTEFALLARLHDRVIVVDGSEVWISGQSFNALAKRSPTSINRVDPDTAKMKIEAYSSEWATAKPI